MQIHDDHQGMLNEEKSAGDMTKSRKWKQIQQRSIEIYFE